MEMRSEAVLLAVLAQEFWRFGKVGFGFPSGVVVRESSPFDEKFEALASESVSD